MDYTYLAYMSLFLALFANELDLFSGNGDTAEEAEDHPLYVPEDFSAEIAGTTAGDSLTAPEGEDNLAWLLGDGADSLTGSASADYADGGGGNDQLFLADGEDIAVGADGADTLSGGAGADTLAGGNGDDRLSGDAGNDALVGEAGNDTLLGGDGSDVLLGGDGADDLTGEAGADTLDGGAGNDALTLGAGDRGTGGEGEDLFQIDYRVAEDGQMAQVNDFAAGDRIELLYTPAYDAEGNEISPELTVAPSADGTAGIIRLGDTAVGAVVGGQALTAQDVTLVREEPEP